MKISIQQIKVACNNTLLSQACANGLTLHIYIADSQFNQQ